eukprot:UN23971
MIIIGLCWYIEPIDYEFWELYSMTCFYTIECLYWVIFRMRSRKNKTIALLESLAPLIKSHPSLQGLKVEKILENLG